MAAAARQPVPPSHAHASASAVSTRAPRVARLQRPSSLWPVHQAGVHRCALPTLCTAVLSPGKWPSRHPQGPHAGL